MSPISTTTMRSQPFANSTGLTPTANEFPFPFCQTTVVALGTHSIRPSCQAAPSRRGSLCQMIGLAPTLRDAWRKRLRGKVSTAMFPMVVVFVHGALCRSDVGAGRDDGIRTGTRITVAETEDARRRRKRSSTPKWRIISTKARARPRQRAEIYNPRNPRTTWI